MIRKRPTKLSDNGFTLIELLVVILIIAILAAVGIVALLGAIRSGQDSAAKQTLANGLKELRSLEFRGYDEVDTSGGIINGLTSALNESSPDIEWQSSKITGDPTNVISIGSVGPEDEGGIIFGIRSKSGKCLYFYSNPLTEPIFSNGISGSHLKMISTESFDECELTPVANQTTPLDLDAYKIY